MPDPSAAAPTPFRQQHERFIRVQGRNLIDSDGNVAMPYRSVDTLALMLKRKTISQEMRDAGERFRDCFAEAQLEPLRAADVSRIPGCGQAPPLGSRIENARRSVWGMLIQVGGIASLPGSCLWHVLGEGQSLTTWATLHGRSREAAGGILVAALSIITGAREHR